ncbi:MAG TPA: D-alanine--D-alanine ligase A, partial [Bifidobacterium sp.]|nr:D-alanine--D-alanine ligase A [Bifidobacterium sp.]
MAKKRIVVMYGGKADEHSISCISTAGVLRALDTDIFEPIPVGITKDGQWIVDGEDPRGWNMDEGLPVVKKTDGAKDVVLDVALGQDGFFARESDGTLTSLGHVDAVLPVLHGPFGEDGTIQGLFEMM